MLTSRVPLTLVLWDYDSVLMGPAMAGRPGPDPRLQTLTKTVADRGLRQAVLADEDSAAVRHGLEGFHGIESVFGASGIADSKGEALGPVAERLDVPRGGILVVDASGNAVNDAAGQGFRTFRYSALAYEALMRQLNHALRSSPAAKKGRVTGRGARKRADPPA